MGRKRWDRIKDERKAIAHERIVFLLREAEAAHIRGEAGFADRYAQLARRLSMRYKVPMPRGAKSLFCRKCSAFIGGGGSRVRINRTGVTRTCLKCGAVWRRPLGKARDHTRTGGKSCEGEGDET